MGPYNMGLSICLQLKRVSSTPRNMFRASSAPLTTGQTGQPGWKTGLTFDIGSPRAGVENIGQAMVYFIFFEGSFGKASSLGLSITEIDTDTLSKELRMLMDHSTSAN